MMGMFNLFIVLPQIASSSLLDYLLKHFLQNEAMNILIFGGASMGVAALLTLLVVSFKSGAEPLVSGNAGNSH
jgi:maltose/moltooligosaccharide transporter